MPMREYACSACGAYKEIYHPSIDPEKVPKQDCGFCSSEMSMLWSIPRLDTGATFHAFTWRGPTGLYHEIGNLHQLRQVEHSYLESGHNVRFDAYSSNENNPDTVDGFGAEYWDGNPTSTKGTGFAFMDKK